MAYDSSDDRILNSVSRRRMLHTAGVGTAALIAGCTGGSDDDGNGGSGGGEGENGGGGSGGDGGDGGEDENVFIEGMGANSSTLDVHGEPRVPNSIVHSAIYDTLFTVNFDTELVPHLVDTFEVNDDSTQYDFYLEEGVTFHDGNDLTADAARRNFERMLEIAPESYLLGPVENIEAVDDLHLRFEMESPFPLLPRNLSSHYAGILSPDAVDEAGDSYGQDTAVGTGPYQLERWDRDEQIVLTRNEDYEWGPEFLPNSGPARIEEVHFRYIPEDTTLFNELTVGNVHGTTYVPTSEAETIANHENTELERVDFPHPNYLAINVTNPPTDDIRVRRAIAHAINKDAVIDAAINGEGYPIWNLAPPLAFNSVDESEAKERGQEFDQAAARDLLEEAGWTNSAEGEVRTKDGEELSIYFTAFSISQYARVGEVAQSMLSGVGFDVNLDILEAGTLYETLEGSEHNVSTMAWSRAKYALEVLEPTLAGTSVATEGGTNYSIWANDEFDELLNVAQSAPEEETRVEAIQNAQRIVLDEVPVVPILGYQKHFGYKADVDTGGYFDHPWWPEQHMMRRLETDI